jgi:hypothetical protein
MKQIFNQDDYNSNDGMLTSIWGPAQWHVLHTMSFNYPKFPNKKEKKYYLNYILSLQHVLPCGKCRKNFINNLKKYPLTMKHMETRDTFSRYLFNLHEIINTMLGKKSGLTFEIVRERYEHFRARCSSSAKSVIEENGCIQPLYGEKSKCIIQIVPQTKKCKTFQINKKCLKTRKLFPH